MYILSGADCNVFSPTPDYYGQRYIVDSWTCSPKFAALFLHSCCRVSRVEKDGWRCVVRPDYLKRRRRHGWQCCFQRVYHGGLNDSPSA